MELTGEGSARASGTGVITGTAHLSTTAGASAHGAGTITKLACMVGSGSARAEGSAILHEDVLMVGSATAKVGGVGYLTWPVPPSITDEMRDLWYYGAARIKDMPGSGSAGAGGTGIL